MLYHFYYKNDSLKESISVRDSNNYQSAVNSFSKTKRLPKEKFLELFIVEEYDRSKEKIKTDTFRNT